MVWMHAHVGARSVSTEMLIDAVGTGKLGKYTPEPISMVV